MPSVVYAAQFGLSQVQAQAILDMQLQRLTGLERQKILDELAELLRTIERLRATLGSDGLLMQIVVDDKMPRDLSDISATLTKIKALQPDIILVSGHTKGATTAVRLRLNHDRSGGSRVTTRSRSAAR